MRTSKYVSKLIIALIVFTLGALIISQSLAVGEAKQTVSVVESNLPIEQFTEIYQQVSPSVVAINVQSVRNGRIGSGAGSGFVIDKEGHIVTNNHVIAGAQRIEVAFVDGTLAWADIVGVDPDSDLAVIQVDVPAERLYPVTFADSSQLHIGQTVLAIGSPFGQRWTLTTGIISALDRTIQGLTEFSIGGVIQTDASINPGNSGGPLLDLNGYVVGVNSQILSASGSNSGVGFAIPSNLTVRVANELISKGYVEYSYLGISGTEVSLSLIESLGLPNDVRGVVVTDVVRDGPAARAGILPAQARRLSNGLLSLQSADIILAINNQPVTTMGQLITYLANHTKPNQTVTLSILRDGEQFDVSVLLTARPNL